MTDTERNELANIKKGVEFPIEWMYWKLKECIQDRSKLEHTLLVTVNGDEPLRTVLLAYSLSEMWNTQQSTYAATTEATAANKIPVLMTIMYFRYSSNKNVDISVVEIETNFNEQAAMGLQHAKMMLVKMLVVSLMAEDEMSGTVAELKHSTLCRNSGNKWLRKTWRTANSDSVRPEIGDRTIVTKQGRVHKIGTGVNKNSTLQLQGA